MKTICFFIFITIFSQTAAKYFLIETDTEEGKMNNGNEAGGIEVEEMAKEGFELKPSTTHWTVGSNTGHPNS